MLRMHARMPRAQDALERQTHKENQAEASGVETHSIS